MIELRRFVLAGVAERMLQLKGLGKKAKLESPDHQNYLIFEQDENDNLFIVFQKPDNEADNRLMELLNSSGLGQNYTVHYHDNQIKLLVQDKNCYVADELAFLIFTKYFNVDVEANLYISKEYNDYDCRPVIVNALSRIEQENAKGIELFYPAEMIKLRIWEEENAFLMELPIAKLGEQHKNKAWKWFTDKGWSCYDHDTGSFLQMEIEDRTTIDKLQFRFKKTPDYVAMYALALFMEAFGAIIEVYLDIRFLTWYEN